MLKIFKNGIFKFILDTVFVIIVLIVGIYTINNKYNVSIFGYNFYINENKNMEPIYRVNDLIIVKEIDYNKLQTEDMICINNSIYKDVVSIKEITGTEVERKFIVSNNVITDREISYTDVLGKVVGFISGFGKVINFLRRYFIIIVLVFVGLTYLTDIKKIN